MEKGDCERNVHGDEVGLEDGIIVNSGLSPQPHFKAVFHDPGQAQAYVLIMKHSIYECLLCP